VCITAILQPGVWLLTYSSHTP